MRLLLAAVVFLLPAGGCGTVPAALGPIKRRRWRACQGQWRRAETARVACGGMPHTQVLLWVYGEQLRAVFDNVVLAEYHCRYDWRERKVTDIHDGVFYPTRFASPQGSLLPLNPQEALVLYRPQALRRPARLTSAVQQLLLFELVHTA